MLLVEEGYELEVRGSYLLIKHVPYVTLEREVACGTLISTLELAGEVTTKPTGHEAHFCGATPCDSAGQPLTKIINESSSRELAPGLIADHFFSAKPSDGYRDYHHKMTSYVAMLAGPAQELNPEATARTHPLIVPNGDEEDIFVYRDTGPARAEIEALSSKLRIGPVAIVGLGGGGAYMLDLLAKTPVAEIHLYDGDYFGQHNAFRGPGAASCDELRPPPQKVAYWKQRYSPMHRKIFEHDYFLDESNVSELRNMAFVFIALDDPEAKRPIIAELEDAGLPFIDIGMGINEVDNSLRGLIRVTTSTPSMREHVRERVSLERGVDGGDYDRNIQIAELNALNAALAVIRFKKFFGFYADDIGEHNSTYVLSEGSLLSEDRA
jgi:hypothetical protein